MTPLHQADTPRAKTAGLVALLGLWSLTLGSASEAAGLPRATPEEVGIDQKHLSKIDDLVAQGLAEKRMPGCVICVGRHGKIVWLKAYGDKQVEPHRRAMTTDTVFDLASITKPVATATSVMLLLERGQLKLGQRVTDWIPEFGKNEKDQITIFDLLTHQSGLLPDNPLRDYDEGPEAALARICDLKLQAPTGTRFIYSDVNFILLGEIVRRASGRSLDRFTREEIFEPLGMHDTMFLPGEAQRARAAPTEQREGRWMQGEVHDPRAWRLGGVAGHAGLFSTAADLAIYAQMLLQGGEYGGVRILAPATVAAMTRSYRIVGGQRSTQEGVPFNPPVYLRGLGWDKRSAYSINRGELFSEAAFGHGGFTGTVLWIDPELDLFFIFLSNRVHPDGKGLVNPLAGRMATVVAASVRDLDAPAAVPGEVLTGIDVLVRDDFRALAGRKVGLITNPTGRTRDGRRTVDVLHQAPGVQLVCLFSPEHGWEGQLDVSRIDDTRDPATGLRVYSLYGTTRRPTPAMLEGIDTLVFDIQDIGTRFYTYVSTMGEAMKAAAEQGRRFVVLDRPNPLGGEAVRGPLLDAGKESFVGFHRLPVQHGMTAGELARMFQDEWKLALDLQVIACEGWRRRDAFDATGLSWVNPSPNMRSLTQAFLYPGVGLLETTNLSVGRGTDTPFQRIGAPWLDGRKLAAELNRRQVPGVRFVPVEFTPASSKFAGERCSGIEILLVDRKRLDALRLGFELATALRRLHPQAWQAEGYRRLLGNDRVLQALLAGQSADELCQLAAEGMTDFLRRRQKYLLYD